MRVLRSILPGLVGVMLLASCGAPEEEPSADTGGAEPSEESDGGSDEAPADGGPPAELEFAAETTEGDPVAGEDYLGEPTAFWFWAPWCTVCRGEAPTVGAIAEEFDGQVDIVGVAGRGELPEMEAFVSETGLEHLDHVVDADGTIWTGFSVASQPAFAFLDADGGVEVVPGALSEDDLRSRLDALAG